MRLSKAEIAALQYLSVYQECKVGDSSLTPVIFNRLQLKRFVTRKGHSSGQVMMTAAGKRFLKSL